MTRRDNAVSKDAAIRLLDNGIRRRVIRILMNTEGEPKTIDDLAASIARPSEQRAVTIRLHHVDLPMLAEANVIEIEPTSGKVTYTGDEVVEELFESLETRSTEESLE